ncbi:hypothetical protein KCP75_25250 [Salmonella enterica subsp. enterica]|nr:hypothetical protein KCP75_25250 [Salmonella enterica subsp. enterica]
MGPDGRYINKYISLHRRRRACESQAAALLALRLSSTIRRRVILAAPLAPVFGAIMGGVLRTMNIEPDALATRK